MKFPSKEVDKRVDVPPDTVSRAYEGAAMAQLMLGKAYLKAVFVENNEHIAFDWILRSAEQGNMEAQFMLGDLYALGQGAIKSTSDAYKWYTKAAIQGYKKALTRIHNLYQEDTRMRCRGQLNSEEEEWTSSPFKTKNRVRELNEYRLKHNQPILNGAIDYYTDQFKHYKSSNQEDPAVQINLAFLYQHGYGVKKYTKWAFEYYTMAAEQEDIDSQYNLGNLYQKHTDKKFNYRDAMKWYIKSAYGGNLTAQRSLAYFYLKGLATDVYYKAALFWYTKAAEAGDSESQVILGKLYRKGDCVEHDLSMAVKWYSRAARQGNIVARNCLVQLHQRDMLDNIELEKDMLEYVTEDLMNNGLCTKLMLDVSKRYASPMVKQLQELARRAHIGDGYAMFEIGLKYLKGDNDFTQDQGTGFKWIKRAAKAKHRDAQLMIADLYKKGGPVNQDYYKAVIWYKTLARKKVAEARNSVGIMYNEGLGVRNDPLEASRWFIWAADQGNSDAQYNFGMLRLQGSGVKQDVKEAVKLFLMSALQRNTQACYKLGSLYFSDPYLGEEEYTTKCLQLIKFAADNGDLQAQLEMARRYKEQRDTRESIEYLNAAAVAGDSGAQCNLAVMYLNGESIKSDYVKAYNLFEQAKDNGDKHAKSIFQIPIQFDSHIKNHHNVLQMFIEVTEKGISDLSYHIGAVYEFGVMLFERHYLKVNYKEAIKWYLLASRNGNSTASYRLGLMHESGTGDLFMAINYYHTASEQNNSDASYRLACMYLRGYGVIQDLLKAFRYFTKAYYMGHDEASKAVSIFKGGNDIALHRDALSRKDLQLKIDIGAKVRMLENAAESGYFQLMYQLSLWYERKNDNSKALKWLTLAASIGVTDAYFRLGIFYEEGRGVDKDYARAAKMYQYAAEKEHEDACYKLGQLYQYGCGVTLNYSNAYHLYKMAADMGQPKAQKVLNITLESRISSNADTEEPFFDTSSQEYSDSISMCEYVAEQGDIEMQFKVGFAYEHYYSVKGYLEACKWYSMAERNSHKEAMYRLGLLYEKGLGVSQDYVRAYRLYEQAGQLGSDDALYRLGKAYYHGIGVEIDEAKVIEYYTLSTEYGNPKYQCELGRLFEEGQIVQKNTLESLKWYTKAYMQGYDNIRPTLYAMFEYKPYQDFFSDKRFRILSLASCALFRLNDSSYNTDGYRDLNNRIGTFYALGYGTKKNMENAWKYFTKEYSDFRHAFKIQDILSFRYGLTLNEKLDILKSFAEDKSFLKQSNAQCLYDLGMILFNGLFNKQHDRTFVDNRENSDVLQNIEKDYTRAFMCLQRAASINHSEALFQLAIMYHCGYGIAQDFEQGERYFKMMSDINPDYAGSIAMLYHTHDGLQDFEKALEWYLLSEERLAEDLTYSVRKKINEQTQTGLGLLYEYGDGVDQDYRKALECYRNLANDSMAVGAYRLGLMYYYGKGTSVDYQTAFDLFGKAIQEASSWSGKLPSVYLDTGLLTDGPQGTLVYRLINASEVIGESYYYLGLMYKNGQDYPQNEEMAQSYFIKALCHRCKRAGYEVVKH